MSDDTPAGNAKARSQARLQNPFRNVGPYAYHTSATYRDARNEEMYQGSVYRSLSLSQQVQRILFQRPAAAQTSRTRKRYLRRKRPQKNTAVLQEKPEDTRGGAGEVHEEGEMVAAGGIYEEKLVSERGAGSGRGASGGQKEASVYSENFKQRYGEGRVYAAVGIGKSLDLMEKRP